MPGNTIKMELWRRVILVVSIIMGTFMIFYVAPGLVNITWVTGLRNKQMK